MRLIFTETPFNLQLFFEILASTVASRDGKQVAKKTHRIFVETSDGAKSYFANNLSIETQLAELCGPRDLTQ